MQEHKLTWNLRRISDTLSVPRLTVRWNRSRNILMFNLGYNVEPQKFSLEVSRCKANTFHTESKTPAQMINRRMELFEESAARLFSEYEGKDLDKETFKREFLFLIGRRTKGDDMTISSTIDEFIKEGYTIHCWSEGTVKKFRTISSLLSEYNRKMKVSDINSGTIQSVARFLSSKGYANSYVNKLTLTMRWYFNWLIKKGYSDISPSELDFVRMKTVSGASKTIVFLTWEELTGFYNFDFGRESLNNVRDVFCFCCFTSLRFSDVQKLRKSDIRDGKIHVVTQKTSAQITIELNDYSSAILDRYKDVKFPGGKALPAYSNQKTNQYLKEMGRIFGLDSEITTVEYHGSRRVERTYKKWELLTTHCGRRTFVVNSLEMGIPAEVVMRWTGHSSYSCMKPYIAVADKFKEKQMQKFNNR